MNKNRKAPQLQRPANAAIKKLLRQELERTLDAETYRQNSHHDVKSLFIILDAGSGSARPF